jgi:hypothetical protein
MKLVRGTYCEIRKLYFWKMWNGKEKWVSLEELEERKAKAARQARELRAKNPEREGRYRRKYYHRDVEKSRRYLKEWRQKNLETRRKQQREYNQRKRLTDPLFLAKGRLRGRLRKMIQLKKFSKKSKTSDTIGCSWEQLRDYIESQFISRMSWGNRHLWHIDHIIPLSSAKTIEELEKLCHYTNLQPLWAADNMSKGSKLVLDKDHKKDQIISAQ